MNKYEKDMIEKVRVMEARQRVYDNAVMAAKELETIDDGDLLSALIDEIGELNHELKPLWCWWKIHVGDIDDDKVLEELIDCIHFALCIRNKHNKKFKLWKFRLLHFMYRKKPYYKLLVKAITSPVNALYYLLIVAGDLGFTFPDVFDEYVRKNDTNWDRLKTGY